MTDAEKTWSNPETRFVGEYILRTDFFRDIVRIMGVDNFRSEFENGGRFELLRKEAGDISKISWQEIARAVWH